MNAGAALHWSGDSRRVRWALGPELFTRDLARTFAFLDATRTGTIVTAIQGRDYARIYVKDIERGTSSVALSPEEETAVERAMGR